MWLDMGRKAYWQQYLLGIVEQLQRVKNCYLLNVRMTQSPYIWIIHKSASTALGSGSPVVVSLQVPPSAPEAAAEAGCGAWMVVLQVGAVWEGPVAVPAPVLVSQLSRSRAGPPRAGDQNWQGPWGEQLGVGCSPWKQGTLLGGTYVAWPSTVGQGLWCKCLKGSGFPCASLLLDIKQGLASYSYWPSQSNICIFAFKSCGCQILKYT